MVDGSGIESDQVMQEMEKGSGGSKRRKSLTSHRMANFGLGQNGSVRFRGSSYQAGDDNVLIPENFVPSSQYLRRGKPKKRCTRPNLCKAVIILLGLLVVYLVFTSIFAFLNTEDPCIVAKRSLKAVDYPTPRFDMPPGWKPELPKIIHQQWKGSNIPNEKYVEWQKEWKKLYPEPEYQHILWTDRSQRDLIKDHYNWFLRYYDSYEFGIQRADAVRYFIMYHYGGLYADLDYEPLSNFWEYLPKDRISLVESPYLYNELVQNSLMSSPKGDPFWEHAFKILVAEHDKPVLSATGPVFLDTTVRTNFEPFHKLPCENFQRIPLGEHDDSPFLTLFHRELLGRLFPMKQCGEYHDKECQFARHHNTASYLKDTGVLKLIWT